MSARFSYLILQQKYHEDGNVLKKSVGTCSTPFNRFPSCQISKHHHILFSYLGTPLLIHLNQLIHRWLFYAQHIKQLLSYFILIRVPKSNIECYSIRKMKFKYKITINLDILISGPESDIACCQS